MLIAPDALWILIGALAVDAIVGDPDWLWRRLPHPVAWLGRLVALGDRHLNRQSASATARRIGGILWLALLLAFSIGVGWLLERGLRALPLHELWIAILASALIAQNSLYRHVARVRDAGTLEAARVAVSMIVGRETARLDEAGISRAAIESAAENFSDGVVAPALWFAIGSLPGLIAYKAVNTADSMIGHLSDRHRDFGWAAARLDDLLNLVPARLAALLVAIAAAAAGGSPRRAFGAAWRDGATHRSPNAGWPEAAMAGALGIALGGPRLYTSGPVDAPFLNPAGRRDAGLSDIALALKVLLVAMLLHIAMWAAFAAAT